MPPFEQDAMGDNFANAKDTTFSAFYISKKTGIPLSATFNNIFVRPDQENLDLFIKNLPNSLFIKHISFYYADNNSKV